MAIAQASATAPADKPKAKRTRKPSAFSPKVRATISIHSAVPDDFSAASVLETSLGEWAKEKGLAFRFVSGRTRKTKTGAPAKGPVSAMIYIAPEGHKWATTPTERGVRLDAATANLLRTVASGMGLDPNDPESIAKVAKALAAKAAGK